MITSRPPDWRFNIEYKKMARRRRNFIFFGGMIVFVIGCFDYKFNEAVKVHGNPGKVRSTKVFSQRLHFRLEIFKTLKHFYTNFEALKVHLALRIVTTVLRQIESSFKIPSTIPSTIVLVFKFKLNLKFIT